MNVEQIIAIFLASFYVFVAGFYLSLIRLRQNKSQTKSLVNSGVKYSAHWWNHMSFRAFRGIILFVCVLRVLVPETDNFLGMLTLPNQIWFNLLGVFALIVGFSLAILSNFSLQQSWRSGIDHTQLSLVTSGLYGLSRNPAYIGVGLAQIGFFFALPCLFSLICMLIGLNALRLQTKLEESFLSQLHPVSYHRYCQRVPKWV